MEQKVSESVTEQMKSEEKSLEAAAAPFAAILTPRSGRNARGWVNVEWTDTRINSGSKVVASACEGGVNSPHYGDAPFLIYNVVPQNGILKVRLYISWDSPLPWRVHVIVF